MKKYTVHCGGVLFNYYITLIPSSVTKRKPLDPVHSVRIPLTTKKVKCAAVKNLWSENCCYLCNNVRRCVCQYLNFNIFDIVERAIMKQIVCYSWWYKCILIYTLQWKTKVYFWSGRITKHLMCIFIII